MARRPPLAKGLPLLGSALGVLRDPIAYMTEQYQRLGPAFRVRVPGRELTVLAGPEANLFVTRESDGLLRSRETWEPFNGEFGARDALTSVDGEKHARLRKLMKRGFSRSALLPHVGMLVATTRAEARSWPVGSRLRVAGAFKHLVTEQLGLVLASTPARAVCDDLALVNRDAVNVHVVGSRPRLYLYRPAYRRALARVLAFGREVLASHRRGPRDPAQPDLVDDLVAEDRRDPGLFTEGELLLAALGPFFAGVDTVANALPFLFYALLRDRDLYERATAEADALFAKEPNAESFRALTVLPAAVQETLRRFPIALALIRRANRAFEFAGCDFHRDEQLHVFTSVSHFLPKLYPDPLRFDPDRFAPHRNEHRQPGAYAPYGQGAHTCLGAGMADVQLLVDAATVLHAVRLELDPPHYELRTVLRPGPTPDDHFTARVVERRHTAAR